MNSSSVIPAFDFRDMVMMAGERVLTTSLKVAQYFNKRHDNVLRKIRQIIADCPDDFAALNFEETDFIDKNGDIQPMFNLTKDGYMLVVMGFTGKAAMQIKITYIQAFNWMVTRLQRRQVMGEDAMHRHTVKVACSKMRATIGSRLMNNRKKEIPRLRAEEDAIRATCIPGLFDDLLPEPPQDKHD